MKALLALAGVLVLVAGADAQSRREDPLRKQQQRLQETQRQLKHEREKAAEARRAQEN